MKKGFEELLQKLEEEKVEIEKKKREEEEEEEKKKKDGIWSHQIERGDNGAKEEWRRR